MVRIINESLPADSDKKYGKARLRQEKEMNESDESAEVLKDKYNKSVELLSKIFDINITEKERNKLRKELKELIK